MGPLIWIQVHIGGWKDKPTAPCFAEVKEIKSTDSTTESLTATNFESGAKELVYSKTNDITVSSFTHFFLHRQLGC